MTPRDQLRFFVGFFIANGNERSLVDDSASTEVGTGKVLGPLVDEVGAVARAGTIESQTGR